MITLASRPLSPIAFTAVQSLEPDCALKLGESGRDVQRLQLTLKELGLYLESLDGDFGFRTERSLMQLQNDLGVEATGEFDLSTWYQLTYWSEDFMSSTNGLLATAVCA